MTGTSGLDPDVGRSVALAAATAGLVTVPTLGPALLGTREEVARYDTPITPPGYAFAIWGPIFAGCIATAARAAGPAGRRSEESRRTGWPLAGASAACAAWSVASQSNRLAATPVLLPAAVAFAGVAYRRLQQLPSGGETVTSLSTGLLLGWTALASVVNLSAATQWVGADPRSRASVLGSAAGAVTAAGVLAGVVGRSRRGYLTLAAASAWGLGSTALDARRAATVRLGTAGGATTLVLAAASTLVRRRAAGVV